MNEQQTVLIIDDNIDSGKLTKDILISLGISDIKIVTSINTAQQYLENNQVIFIVTEQNIGRDNAIDFIRHFRGNFHNKNYRVPVLMVFKNPAKHTITAARDSGVTEMIVRPFNFDTLTKIILSFLKNPRNFIISRGYVGPDRRRKKTQPPDGKIKRKEDKS